MPSFSKKSLEKLNTCNPQLIDLFKEVIKEYDFVVLCGHRGEEEQNKAFKDGFSKLKFPKSKHNTLPSKAVDIAPYPIDWNDLERFKELAVIVKKIALQKNVKIQWGGDWKMRDYPHFELIG